MTYVIYFGELTIQRKQVLIGIIVIIALLISSVGIMIWWQIQTNEANAIDYVEIREYEGQDLSSINAFRENSIKGPQHIDNQTYRLAITGLANNQNEYTYEQIINDYPTYRKVVTLNCVEGWKATILWEGIRLKDLLADAQVTPEANTVIFHAYDEYTTSLPLDYIIDKDIMIAYKMNNVTLPPERGFPFELVAESKWGYKWIRWITTIELSSNPDYKGFWESRGYPNDADL